MVRLKDMVEWKTVSGDKVTVGDISLTPVAQALIVRCAHGGLVWNRPVALLVERDGHTQRVPIVDVTRLVQIGLLGLTLICLVVTLVQSVARRRVHDER